MYYNVIDTQKQRNLEKKIFLLAVVIALFIALLTIAGLLIGGVGSTYALSCPSSPLYIFTSPPTHPCPSTYIISLI
jgi:hypothetical protein